MALPPIQGTERQLRLIKSVVDTDDDDFFIWFLPVGFCVGEVLVQSQAPSAVDGIASLAVGFRFSPTPVTTDGQYRSLDPLDAAQSSNQGASGRAMYALPTTASGGLYEIRCPIGLVIEQEKRYLIGKVQINGPSSLEVCCGLVPWIKERCR